MKIKKILCLALVLTSGLLGTNSLALAQNDDNAPLASDLMHFYEEITLDKLSRLYWKLQKLDINNDEDVDNYLMINECEIYKEYRFNELEWNGIRKKARVSLKENVGTFPDRFKFTQPLRFGEYNAETKIFSLLPEYEINGMRKFEVLANDYETPICMQRQAQNIARYERALLIELTQPINLAGVPMTKLKAEKYIADKYKDFNAVADTSKTKEVLYSYRDAYLVMKIKVMAYKGHMYVENMAERAIVYALLEGFEIYSDQDQTDLLYFENFIREDGDQSIKARLKEQYEQMRLKRGQKPAPENKNTDNDADTNVSSEVSPSSNNEQVNNPAPDANKPSEENIYNDLGSLHKGE